jgi:hypothetical protein
LHQWICFLQLIEKLIEPGRRFRRQYIEQSCLNVTHEQFHRLDHQPGPRRHRGLTRRDRVGALLRDPRLLTAQQ